MLEGASKIHLILQGCGFLGAYSFGAIVLLSQIWPQRPCYKISGASCGSIMAVLTASGVSLVESFDTIVSIGMATRKLISNPIRLTLQPISELLRSSFDKRFPDNIHKRVNGRVGVSVTRVHDWTNQLVSYFESKHDLIDAIVCSCFIPLWAGLSVPTFRGASCIDGCYTNNSPRLHLEPEALASGVRYVTISPFAGDADVSPQDTNTIIMLPAFGTGYYLNGDNLRRARNALVPSLSQTFTGLLEGYCDMKAYLLRHCTQLLNCGTPQHSHSSCLRCLLIYEKVSNLRLPNEYVDVIRYYRPPIRSSNVRRHY
ncbi:Patatin-like phospholipase domain-containing protein 2 [Fragariocoptes setiger]|uniref:Patatin-like phospholipase domain-containing protein 2 n=1 Tax=Fragariocoptes setiger TaxID=1670756 RepID=A0ABQ7S5Z1_9ACAR|nr:Patatin-like phospholipase domain-containing protein 2 [Fragariocoptes setiger]